MEQCYSALQGHISEEFFKYFLTAFLRNSKSVNSSSCELENLSYTHVSF